jgi:hypothetical protein
MGQDAGDDQAARADGEGAAGQREKARIQGSDPCGWSLCRSQASKFNNR